MKMKRSLESETKVSLSSSLILLEPTPQYRPTALTRTHLCPGQIRARVQIRECNYAGELMWQMDSGRHPEFNLHFCPYCGEALDVEVIPIPTSMTRDEAVALQRLARGRNVLEIGSLLGYSTIQLAKVAKAVWAVDPHEGYPKADPRPTLQGFLKNVRASGFGNRIVPILGRGQEVLPALARNFELVFIDITSSAKDLILLAKALCPRWIAVHDYGNREWTGGTEAVDSFMLQHSHCSMEVVDSLAIITAPGCDGFLRKI